MEKAFDRIPEHLKPRNEGTEALFKKGWMEKLTRTHISIPVTLHLIIVGLFLYYGGQGFFWTIRVLLFVAGWLTWTLAEYWVHRWLYHVKTTNRLILRIQHVGHGIHHQYPKDPTRLAMPPLPALLLITLFFSIFWLIMRQYAFIFFPGFLFGYITYITLHYFQHVIKPPKFKPLNNLWKWHAMHHYRHPETKAFGVSTRLWDYVFRTAPE